MNSGFLITFFIVLGAYFVGLVVFSIIKRIKNKKLVNKDKEEFEKSDNDEGK